MTPTLRLPKNFGKVGVVDPDASKNVCPSGVLKFTCVPEPVKTSYALFVPKTNPVAWS